MKSPDSSTPVKSAWKILAWSFIEKVGLKALPVVSLLVLANFLTPKDFGVVATVSLLIAFLQAIIEGLVWNYIVSAKNLDSKSTTTAFYFATSSSAVMATVLFFCATPLTVLFNIPGSELVVYALIGKLILACLTLVPQALLMRQLRTKQLATWTLLSSSLGMVAGISAAVGGWGVWSLVAQTLVAEAFRMVFIANACRWFPKGWIDWSRGKRIASFGSASVGNNLVGFVSQRADEAIIAVFLGPGVLGLYVVAKGIAQTAITLTGQILTQVYVPLLARQADDRQAFRSTFYTAYKTTATLSVPLYFAAACVVGSLMPLLMGETWDDAWIIAAPLLVAGALQTIFGLDTASLIAAGKPGKELIVVTLIAASRVLLTLAFVSQGLVVLAVVLGARAFLFWPVRMWGAKRFLQFRLKAYAPHTGIVLGLGLPLYGVVYYLTVWNETSPLINVVAAVLATLLYVAALFVLSPFARSLVMDAIRRRQKQRDKAKKEVSIRQEQQVKNVS